MTTVRPRDLLFVGVRALGVLTTASALGTFFFTLASLLDQQALKLGFEVQALVPGLLLSLMVSFTFIPLVVFTDRVVEHFERRGAASLGSIAVALAGLTLALNGLVASVTAPASLQFLQRTSESYKLGGHFLTAPFFRPACFIVVGAAFWLSSHAVANWLDPAWRKWWSANRAIRCEDGE